MNDLPSYAAVSICNFKDFLQPCNVAQNMKINYKCFNWYCHDISTLAQLQ